jgi:Flp pilus assembly pilin Flp
MLASFEKISRELLSVSAAFMKSESGAAALEYSAAAGVMTGIIFFAFQELRVVQAESLERVLSHIG